MQETPDITDITSTEAERGTIDEGIAMERCMEETSLGNEVFIEEDQNGDRDLTSMGAQFTDADDERDEIINVNDYE